MLLHGYILITRARVNNLPRNVLSDPLRKTDGQGGYSAWCVYYSWVATILYTLWHNLARRQNAGELTTPPPAAAVLPVRWAVINLILYYIIQRVLFRSIVPSCRIPRCLRTRAHTSYFNQPHPTGCKVLFYILPARRPHACK